MVEMVSILPEEVESVMYHTMAYCTREEPKSDMVCAVKKRAVVCFQWEFTVMIPRLSKIPYYQIFPVLSIS